MVHKLDKKAEATFSCSLIHKGSLHIDLADFLMTDVLLHTTPKKICVSSLVWNQGTFCLLGKYVNHYDIESTFIFH